jgi:hypothetical protein
MVLTAGTFKVACHSECHNTARHFTDAQRFLDAIEKLPKAIISFAISVCLSVRTKHLGFHCTDFEGI